MVMSTYVSILLSFRITGILFLEDEELWMSVDVKNQLVYVLFATILNNQTISVAKVLDRQST